MKLLVVCSEVVISNMYHVQEGWSPSCSRSPQQARGKAPSRASTHVRAGWRWCARPLYHESVSRFANNFDQFKHTGVIGLVRVLLALVEALGILLSLEGGIADGALYNVNRAH